MDDDSAHTQSLSLWLSVRRSWTESEAFRDKQMWTPSSPDFNAMFFAVWSILKKDVSTRYHPNLNSLKTVIQVAWAKFGRKSGVTFFRFSESSSHTHHQCKMRSFRNLVCPLYFQKTSEKFCRRIFSFSLWYYFYQSFSIFKSS